MPDIVPPDKRSQMMAGIKGTNTRPELLVRSLLHRLGFRFRIHDKKLPGKPDLVLPRFKAVILIHGCFWHGHDCSLFKLPSTNRAFWKEKIDGNRRRDLKQVEALNASGYRVLTIWECALRGKSRMLPSDLAEKATQWLVNETNNLDIRGL